MGLIATDVSQTVEFSLASDQGEDRTVFTLRPLDMRERAFVTGKLERGTTIKAVDDKEEVIVERGIMTPESVVDGTIWAARLGLCGWRNFVTAAGSPVEVQTEAISIPGIGTRKVLTEECVLRNFTKGWVDEISAEILAMSKLAPGQRKN
jgi:hypothetical protein